MPVLQFPLDGTHPKRHDAATLLMAYVASFRPGVRVAVIDTGIDPKWLAANGTKRVFDPAHCLDFTQRREGPYDTRAQKHGSRVIQYVSTFSGNAELYSLRIHGHDTLGDRPAAIRALDWCAENKISVVNLSLAIYDESCTRDSLCALCRRINTHSVASNMFSVVTCGDAYSLSEKIDDDEAPAYCPSHSGLAWGVASPEVVDLRSELVKQKEGGLSFTTARFSGCLSLLRSALPSLDVFDIRQIIQRTCIRHDPRVPVSAGFGRQSFLLAYLAGSRLIAHKEGSSQDVGDLRQASGWKRRDLDGNVCAAYERIAGMITSSAWSAAAAMSQMLTEQIVSWAGPFEMAIAEYIWASSLESLGRFDEAAQHYTAYNNAASCYLDGAWPSP